jgi:hypothetical protein
MKGIMDDTLTEEIRCWLALRRHMRCTRLTAQRLQAEFYQGRHRGLGDLIACAPDAEALIADAVAIVERRA